MKCPQCETQMKASPIDHITIHECGTCKGMWFARGDLQEVKDELLPDLSWLDIDEWKSQLTFTVQPNPLNCPQCYGVTLTMVRDPQSDTEISICAQCGGSWLSTRQFIRMVDALHAEADSKSSPEIVRILLGQIRELLSSPDAVVSEWKDTKRVLRLLYHRIFVEHPKLKSALVGIQESLPL
jgi:Zn-finger nucleic acid-binding protein